MDALPLQTNFTFIDVHKNFNSRLLLGGWHLPRKVQFPQLLAASWPWGDIQPDFHATVRHLHRSHAQKAGQHGGLVIHGRIAAPGGCAGIDGADGFC